MNEDELRQLVSKSEKDGFRAIFQQYQNFVYSIVWGKIRTVGTVEDAEECVSDVFAEVFFNFSKINNGSLQAYISVVAKRTAVDKFRKLSIKADSDSEEDKIKNLADSTDIAGNIENAERNRLIYEKIRSLGEPDSTLIIQKYYYDKKSNEIAKNVGMSPVAVRVRLNRALKRLKKIFIDENIEL